jgi:hypothetical protein
MLASRGRRGYEKNKFTAIIFFFSFLINQPSFGNLSFIFS